MTPTPAQRYRQAVTKARILGRRQIRQMVAGERDCVECTGDMEREFIIREIERAYEAGRRSQ